MHDHYKKDVSKLQFVDVYRVCELFGVSSQPLGHAIKKLLCAGQRGTKGYSQDLQEAIDSINRALQMDEENKTTETIEQSVMRSFLSEKQSIGRALRGSPPWYPDDSGEWVEIDPGHGFPNGLKLSQWVEILILDERERKEYSTEHSRARYVDWSVKGIDSVVAYKKANP